MVLAKTSDEEDEEEGKPEDKGTKPDKKDKENPTKTSYINSDMLAYKEPTTNLLAPKEKDDKSNNGKDKDNGKPDEKGNENAINRGKGKKLGLLKKLGIEVEDKKKTGQVENILAVIDQIVNGEMNLPAGEHEETFALVREVGKGYTVTGTNWTYNERNQITHKENYIRMEEYDYLHDDAGNMTSNERSQYSWNAKGLLEEVVFPDGSCYLSN